MEGIGRRIPFGAHKHVAAMKGDKGHLHNSHAEEAGEDLLAI